MVLANVLNLGVFYGIRMKRNTQLKFPFVADVVAGDGQLTFADYLMRRWLHESKETSDPQKNTDTMLAWAFLLDQNAKVA